MCRNWLFPPARGVIVNAAAFPAGLLTVKIEFTSVVVIMLMPIISEVPVALPTTVTANLLVFTTTIIYTFAIVIIKSSIYDNCFYIT